MTERVEAYRDVLDTREEDSVELLQGFSSVDLRQYERLARVDRTHAQALARFCHVSPDAVKASRFLANHSLLQSLITSVPLVLADCFSLWFLLFGTTTVVERLCGVPHGLVTGESAVLASLLLIPIAQIAGLYPAMGTIAAVEFRQLVRSAAVALCVFAGIGIVQEPAYWHYFIASTLITLLLIVPVLPTARFVTRAAARRCRWWGAPTLVYADSASVGSELFRRLSAGQERGLRPIAVVMDSENYWRSTEELEELGIPSMPLPGILDCAVANKATWILIANSSSTIENYGWNNGSSMNVANSADAMIHSIPNRVVLSAFGGFDCGVWDRTHTVGSSCGLLLANSRHCQSTLLVKRFLDFSLSLLICLTALPLFALIAVGIYLTSPGRIIYGQKRIGRGGRSFTAWKFRTMVPDADRVLHEYLQNNPALKREWDQTHKLKNDPRVTWIGRFLRLTSFDELPQLWNVLRGEMSLVGPRPIVNSPTYDATYVRDYPREFAMYTSVRPGLTGMWQVTCRNSAVYEMRIYWDMYYIRNWSLWLDLYIILRTVRTVVLREGAA